MTDQAPLVDRLAALPKLKDIPLAELEWLVSHGQVVALPAGRVIAPKGRRIEYLWIILSGGVAAQADRGAGPRRVAAWYPGDVSGMLPYSRMKGPPGDNYVEADSEFLAVHEREFPEMVHRCPTFTAMTVHMMLDRARSFNTSDLQDEKMASLGKLAAGLAHELNNPASATVRGAKQLRAGLAEADAAARALGAAGLNDEMVHAIETVRASCLVQTDSSVLSPIEQADREDEVADWLTRHGADPAYAGALTEAGATLETLEALVGAVPEAVLEPAVRWIAAGCATQGLARDIEEAAGRIHDLVAAVKRFTYMDNVAGPGSVDVSAGLRDAIRVIGAKARSRGAAITLDVPPDLPRAHAIGNELNQVWLNLLDNALDAVSTSGRVAVSARLEHDRIVIRVTDNGVGIPADVLPRVFDPFFTTKPPGQGTGLGLEISRQLVRQSQGDISVESRPGHTEFRVSLAAEPAA